MLSGSVSGDGPVPDLWSLRSVLRWPVIGLVLLVLSACGSSGDDAPLTSGNAADPWGHHIRHASARFDVPEPWIRAVIEVESGGNTHLNGRPITSRSGAMGLMQLLPSTYAELRRKHGLGRDAHNPRDNILAGTAYLREMYDRFGAPGTFAAYNGGPRTLEDHLYRGRPLPQETRNYVALIWPAVRGVEPRRRAPVNVALRIDRAPARRAEQVRLAAWAGRRGDDGTGPVTVVATAPPQPVSAVPAPVIVASGSVTRPVVTVAPPPTPTRPTAVASAPPPPRTAGDWGIQVGAFSTRAAADTAAVTAARMAPEWLRNARTASSEVETHVGLLFRARLVGLDANGAAEACRKLMSAGSVCRVVPPAQV